MNTNMKNYTRIFVLLLVFAIISCSQPKQPNFLFIITDDQSYNTIAALGNNEIETPNMDKLVDEGIAFTQCFNQGSWSGAVCVASRTMLITGQTLYNAPKNKSYLDSWAQLKNTNGNYEPTEVPTWAEVFSENGYKTFITGKWHNASYSAIKGFEMGIGIGDGMYPSVDANGDKNFAYNRPKEKNIWSPSDSTLKGHWSPLVWDITSDDSGVKIASNLYEVNKHTSELYADNAINYLQCAKDDKPFFMFVSFNAPHDPRQSPQTYVDKYPASSIKIPKNYMHEHPFNQGDNNIRDEKLAPFPRTKEAVQLHISEYYAIITHFDNELGRILKALEESGQKDNTYIILTSDHGLALGQHGLMGKQNQYDHSVRMPFIIVGPDIEEGKRIDDMIYMQSVYATTCDLANIEIPESVEFKSIEGLLNGKSEGEEYIFGGYKHLQRMLRTDKYKLIIYPKVNEIQLFDMENDPMENDNLAYNKEYKETVKIMFTALVKKQKELGDNLILELNKILD